MVSRTPAPDQGRGGRAATTDIKPGQAGLSINDPGTTAPEGWAWTPLLRIARQETGHTPSRSKSTYWDGNVPWVGIKDAGSHHGRTIDSTLQTITEDGLANSSARLLPAGTVCLSRTASVGYVTILGRPMATSQDFATWTCSEALLPEYLMFALMAEGDDIRDFGEGTTHTTIYFPEIRALTICLPPLAEQQAIVECVKQSLADIDRMVTEAAAARRLLDRLDQAILAKAFRGELVSQDPADEPANVLLERIKAQRKAVPKVKREEKAYKTRRMKDLTIMTKTLEQVLAEAGDWISAQDAFDECGIGAASTTEEVEKIYAELRQIDKAGRLATEPVNDDWGRKLYDRIKLKVS